MANHFLPHTQLFFVFTKKKKKGQVWSIDTFIAFLFFLAAIAFFIGYLSSTQETGKSAKKESETIPQLLSSESFGVTLIKNNEIDREVLQQLVAMDYQTLQSVLGVKNNFCIYFLDANNNLINLSELLVGYTRTIYGIGDGTVVLNVSRDGTKQVRCTHLP
ncbi:MAG: hypothetical protein QW594_01025 [Candidatus Woesearchaeota archaeon]